MFAMAKLMEMESTEQNKVALYLFNSIQNKNKMKVMLNFHLIFGLALT